MPTPTAKSKYRLLLSRVRSVPGLGKDVLAVAVIVAVGLAVSGFLLANQRVTWPWEHEFVLRAELTSAPSIAPGKGQEVRIAGVPVGEIKSAEVSDHGTAILTLAIHSPDTIYDNARLALRPKSPLNEMYVTIAPGGPPGQPLSDGALLTADHTAEPVPVDEVLSHLDVKAQDAMTSMLSDADVALANMPRTLPPGLTAADNTLVGLKPVVDALNDRRDRLRTLTDSLSQIATAVGGNDVRLARTTASLQTTLGTLARNDDALVSSLDQLPDVSTQLRRATAGADKLSDQLNPTLDKLHEASGALPGSLSNLQDTVDKLGDTVDAAKPFLDAARPVLRDLRPFVGDLRGALDDLEPTTHRLDTVTDQLIPYLPDLKAFMANTASVTSVRDANGPFFRGRFTFAPETLPFLPKAIQRSPKEAPTR
jgi:phospholipid/cholesterol/gamma-HCH transport system substrate-binding protein